MTDEQDKNTSEPSDAAPTNAEGEGEAEVEREPTDEAKAEDSEDGDDDESSAKPDKPKKLKINYEAAMPRNEAVSYFEAIVAGLRSGRLEFKQEGEALVLNPPDHLEVEVKAQRKGDKSKVVFELEWSEPPALEILS